MDILIATHNPAKFERYKRLVSQTGNNLNIFSLRDLNISAKVEEPFSNSKENAIYKAKRYAEASNMITVAIDEAVTTNFLPNNEQPGVYVRRLKKDKTEATDEQVLEFWQKTFEIYPQADKKFIWNFSIAYFDPAKQKSGSSEGIKETKVVQPFSKKIDPGYPMSSFLSFIGRSKAFVDMTEQEKREIDDDTFINFVEDFRAWLRKN